MNQSWAGASAPIRLNDCPCCDDAHHKIHFLTLSRTDPLVCDICRDSVGSCERGARLIRALGAACSPLFDMWDASIGKHSYVPC